MTTDRQPIDPRLPFPPWDLTDRPHRRRIEEWYREHDPSYQTPAERRAIRNHLVTVTVARTCFGARTPQHALKGT